MAKALSCRIGVNPPNPCVRAGCIVPERGSLELLLIASNLPEATFPRYIPMVGPSDDSTVNPGRFIHTSLSFSGLDVMRFIPQHILRLLLHHFPISIDALFNTVISVLHSTRW